MAHDHSTGWELLVIIGVVLALSTAVMLGVAVKTRRASWLHTRDPRTVEQREAAMRRLMERVRPRFHLMAGALFLGIPLLGGFMASIALGGNRWWQGALVGVGVAAYCFNLFGLNMRVLYRLRAMPWRV
ncbi:MAG TPA: hypothetical protein VGM93_09345 [Acidimicrobiales bacterium]